jgi:hypothetical protein
MVGLSAYAEQRALHHFFRGLAFTPPTNVYCRLFNVPPTDDGSGGTEVTGNGYQGQLLQFGAYTGRQIRNSNTVQFTNSGSSPWPQANNWCAFDAQSGGNLLFTGTLDPKPALQGGASYPIDPANLVITYNGGTTYIAQKILELIFKATAHASPALVYGSLFSAAPSGDGTGGTELAATGYVRKAMTMAAYVAASKRIFLGADLQFIDVAPVAWGAIQALVINDSVTIGGGNRMLVLPFTVVPTVALAGAFSIVAADTYVQLD